MGVITCVSHHIAPATGANLCYYLSQHRNVRANANSKTCLADRVEILCLVKAMNHLFFASFVLFPSSAPLLTFRSTYTDKNTK